MNNNHFFAWHIRTRGDVDIIANYAECIITYLNRWICARGRGWETLSPARKVTQPPLHENSSSACVKIFAAHNINNITKTLPKAQRTQGLSSTYQINFFGSYDKFKHKSWSNIFRISTLHQLQNLNQTSPFRQNLNLKILTKTNQNLDQEWTS